ncbi:M949_RS01915 family surface polysaccharide biosynthesis protein [Bermanella sp. R86510]|uniref:M949_RS01915 family surface polysaccharide biosynthesis protein n=1 Tax=unclassified Bermanella TaxID=2627862 RepID=UPI0037CB881B
MKALKKVSFIYFLMISSVTLSDQLLDFNHRFNGGFELSTKTKSNLFIDSQDSIVAKYNVKADREYEIYFRQLIEHNPKSGKSYYLFVSVYELKSDEIMLIREVKDFVLECTLDGGAKFLDRSFTVTDLNGNGQPEFTFLYDLKCTGDLSPNRMKLIMLEGESKSTLRGLRISEQIYESDWKDIEATKNKLGWGGYDSESEFIGKHPLLLEFSKLRWDYFKIDFLSN